MDEHFLLLVMLPQLCFLLLNCTCRYDLQLDFLEAVFGVSKEIEVSRLTNDPACEGSGVKPGTTTSSCPQCGGSGQVISAVRTPLGAFQQVSVCPRCEGSGQIFIPCEKCGGDGRIRETKRIALKVGGGSASYNSSAEAMALCVVHASLIQPQLLAQAGLPAYYTEPLLLRGIRQQWHASGSLLSPLLQFSF
jgi:hypothetical protein